MENLGSVTLKTDTGKKFSTTRGSCICGEVHKVWLSFCLIDYVRCLKTLVGLIGPRGCTSPGNSQLADLSADTAQPSGPESELRSHGCILKQLLYFLLRMRVSSLFWILYIAFFGCKPILWYYKLFGFSMTSLYGITRNQSDGRPFISPLHYIMSRPFRAVFPTAHYYTLHTQYKLSIGIRVKCLPVERVNIILVYYHFSVNATHL